MPALKAFIRHNEARLREAGIDNPALDARLLIGHALGLDRAQLVSQSERLLSEDELSKITPLIERRLQREPVTRILGAREFWGLPFRLNEATLEPRPDSETLVQTALALLPDKTRPYRMLDLGTGTGCLLLSLLHERPQASGIGIDLAPCAVAQATENASQLGLAARALFRAGDWLQSIDEKFDLIISNPPYIPRHDITGLMPEVRDYDPVLALDGGADGLEIYRLLIPQLPLRLHPHAHVVFEVGSGQAEAVAGLLRNQGFKDVATHRDLGLIERCVSAHHP